MEGSLTEASAAAAAAAATATLSIPRPGFRPVTCPVCNKEFPSDNARRGHMRVHGRLKNSGLGLGSDDFAGMTTVMEGWQVKGKRTNRCCVDQGSGSAFSGYSVFSEDDMIVAEALLTLASGSPKVCNENNNDYEEKMKVIMSPEEYDNDDDDDDDDDDEDELPKGCYGASTSRPGYSLGSPLSPDYCYGSTSCSVSDSDSFPPLSTSYPNCGPSTPYLTIDLNTSPPITPPSTSNNPPPLAWYDAGKSVIKRKKSDGSVTKKKMCKNTSAAGAGAGAGAAMNYVPERVELVDCVDGDDEIMEVAKRWECDICNKTFPTHQALGGHKSSHRKEKIIIDGENSNNLEDAFKYKCKICNQCFASGQALGGHQRCHYVPSSPQSASDEQVINSGTDSRTGDTDTDMVDVVDDTIDLTLRLW